MLLLYRNQPIDVHFKSIGWFLCHNNTCIKWVDKIIKRNRDINNSNHQNTIQRLKKELVFQEANAREEKVKGNDLLEELKNANEVRS